MPSPLFDYQLDGVNQAYHAIKSLGGFYFVWDPGMGKTLGAITLARLLKVRRIVIVCPVVAKGVWLRELDKWWPNIDPEFFPEIWSWDAMVGNVKALCQYEPELLILDEAHYAKTPSAQRTKAATQLRQWSIYCLSLSGTPQHNELDLYAQYKLVAREEPIFRQSFTDYRNNLCQMAQPGGGITYPRKRKDGSLAYKPGAREAVAEAIAPYTHTADASLMHLDEPIVTEIPVTLDNKEEDAYASMESILKAELPDGSEVQAEIVLTKLLRLSQIAAGHATNTAGDVVRLGSSKLDSTLELLEARAHHKVVIACRFREDISALVSALNRSGRPCAKIDGDTPAKYRTQYEDWFERGRHDNGVLLLQYQAGGVAITLATARTLILYTLDHSVIRYRQMIGRVWRTGQQNAVEILPLLADGTQDWAMWQALQTGSDNANIAKLLLRYLRR